MPIPNMDLRYVISSSSASFACGFCTAVCQMIALSV
jgi:hypothetical protein